MSLARLRQVCRTTCDIYHVIFLDTHIRSVNYAVNKRLCVMDNRLFQADALCQSHLFLSSIIFKQWLHLQVL